MSIIEVARKAGVSKSTVSRVINQQPGVAPEAAEAVKRAIKAIGYILPTVRRGPKPGLKRGLKTGNVALLAMGSRIADLYRMPVFPQLLHAIERTLAEQNLKLVLGNLAPDCQLPTVLEDQQADGLLLYGKWANMPPAIRNRLKQFTATWIVREHSDPQHDFDHVIYNNPAVGRLAAEYFIERSHKHVAFLNVAPEHTAFAERLTVFKAALAAQDVKVSVLVPEGNEKRLELATFQMLVERAMKMPDRPTGLFIPSDTQLPGLYHSMHQLGIKPCRDIEILSCDNEEQFLGQLTPRPATIDIKLDLVGRQAVRQLLWRLKNPNEAGRMNIYVEPTLVLPKKTVISVEAPDAG